MIVVADTSPINYLCQLDLTNLLKVLYGEVWIPQAVFSELQHPKAPLAVRSWAASLPDWVKVRRPSGPLLIELASLDAGEAEAIALAVEMKADILLLDEQDARFIAQRNFGLRVTGVLGVLRDAHAAGIVDAHAALAALEDQTNFYLTPQLKTLFLLSIEKL
jgi:predicted nucleic acid-binding protein